MLIQCPNPACKANCSIAETNCGAPVRCPKCGKPFVVRPTGDGRKSDTGGGPPAAAANPFPVLPAEFGRYRILRLLGRGGMGAVYLAQDSQLGRQVALKVPFFDAAASPQRAERFVREARSAAVLQHPNICTVFDAGQINGRPFITMAFIAGAPLEQEIDPEAPMPQARAAEIIRKMALALQHAHAAGIVHRDLKPANVMMTADGEPVIMDFGLAKRVIDVDPNEAKLTRVGGILGTPSYMSPEQVKGDIDAIGPATDVYSLGVMLFEMLTGQTPYTGPMSVVIGRILTAPAPPVQEFRPDVHPQLDAICRKAMAKEPAARFASMTEFADALSKYLKAAAASSPPLPAPPVAAVLQAPLPVVGRSPFDHLEDAAAPPPALKKAKRVRVVAVASSPQKWLVAAGVAVCLLLVGLVVVWAGGVFKVKTADGILVVQVNEPNAEVFVDGTRMTVSWNDGGTKAEIHVKPGTRKVEVKKDGFGVDGTDLTFRDGDREVFTARLLPEQGVAKADQAPPEKSPPPDTKNPDAPPVAGAANDNKGFVPLFNGQDLTGWEILNAPDRASWTVENGVLYARSKNVGWPVLCTKQTNFGDFHLRTETMLTDGEPGAIQVCATLNETSYKININGPQQEQALGAPRTGSLYRGHPGVAGPTATLQLAQDASVKPGEWFLLEVMATGNRVRILVKGKLVVDYTDPQEQTKRGGSIMISMNPDTRAMQFRKIEIKELK